jgi:PST family polysaccharide transporter
VARQSAISHRTATASGAFVIARLGTKALDLISLTVLARLLTPDDFGLIAIAMVFIQVVETIFEVPIGALLLRAHPLTRALLDTGFTLSAIRGLIVFGLSASAAFAIADFYSDPRLVWLVVALAGAPLARSVGNIRIVLYSRQLNALPEFWLEIGSKAAAVVAAITVAVLTGSYWAIAVATLTAPIVNTACSYFWAPYLPRFRISEWPFFSDFIGWMTANQLFSAMLWQFDKLFLGRFVSSETLGRFYMAGNLSALPFQIIGIPLLRPFAAALALSDTRNTLADAFQKATRAVCLVMAPIIVSLAFLAHPIISLLLGEKWESASQWFAFLALANLPALPIQTLAPLCIALNKAGALAARSGLELALYVPMVALGYFAIGIPGVICARFLSLLVSAIISMFLVRTILNLGIRKQLANLLAPAVTTVVLALVLAFLTTVIPEPSGRIALIAYIGGIGTLGTVVYGLAAIALWNATGRRDGVEHVAANILAALVRRARLVGARRG